MSDKIIAPFTEEQVINLNNYQTKGKFHPFTCCGHNGCNRMAQTNEGLLVATTDGWICPCEKYTQDWAHAFMAENRTQDLPNVMDFITHSNE